MSLEHALREIKLDLRKYMMKPAKRSKVVKLSEMKDFFMDSEAVEKILSKGKDPVIYQYYEFIEEEAPGHLTIGLTVLYPGKVGKEYFMTRGHFHEKDSAELYYGIYGEGILLIQSRQGETDYMVLKPGTIGYVPPGWGHRTINTGRKRFVFLFAYFSDAGHDYGVVKEKGFAKIVIEEKGKPKVVDNPKYLEG